MITRTQEVTTPAPEITLPDPGIITPAPVTVPQPTYVITYEQVNALITFMKLWTQLGMWTRALMISTVGLVDNKEAVVGELYSVGTELYNILRVFYGPAISQQILNLLTNFITNEWSLIEAVHAGDKARVDESTMALYQTADQMAALLSQINVYWYEDQWRNLLYQYIRTVVDEMIAISSGDFVRAIEIYKRLDDITDLMGSYMARGIIARSTGSEFQSQ